MISLGRLRTAPGSSPSSWVVEPDICDGQCSHPARIGIELNETLLANPASILARNLVDDRPCRAELLEANDDHRPYDVLF